MDLDFLGPLATAGDQQETQAQHAGRARTGRHDRRGSGLDALLVAALKGAAKDRCNLTVGRGPAAKCHGLHRTAPFPTPCGKERCRGEQRIGA